MSKSGTFGKLGLKGWRHIFELWSIFWGRVFMYLGTFIRRYRHSCFSQRVANKLITRLEVYFFKVVFSGGEFLLLTIVFFECAYIILFFM